MEGGKEIKQIITKTINWHSVAEEGLPKVSGTYFIKEDFIPFGTSVLCDFSVNPIEVNPIEVRDEDGCFECFKTEIKGKVFYWTDDDEWSTSCGKHFTIDGVTHYANVETDCMETVEFID